MNNIYEIVLLITLLKSMVLVRKFNLSSQNYLFIYLLVTFLVELFSEVIILLEKKWSFQYTLYCIFCILFFWFYYSRQFNRNLKKKVNLLSVILMISILIFPNFLGESLNSKLISVLPFFYILYSMLWFYQKIAFPSKDKITDDPNFWISSALLFWSCFFIFREIPRDFFNKTDKDFLNLLWQFLYFISSIMYILFFKGLMKYEAIAKDLNK
ncbi:hypothetical protein [Flavobacterium sp. PL02]|uniref:hypothetical protein n=1 Tax=Flavobacterium sp. PL02 TaxID=3088354 RepID=UPI002B23733D|nr:hypothetical protein [Flavobacterium sp. PL02]MEA9414474.1 hypothetical protein [Flavobacterium sp. PL02]